MKTKKQKLRIAVLAALMGSAVSTQAAATLVAGWDFEKVEADGITIKSKAGNYAGEVQGAAVLTAAGGGRPGAGGGKGFSVGTENPGWLLLAAGGLGEGDSNPMTAAAADDSMTVVLWQKNDSNINSSSFWAIGPGFDRAFQFHAPWSDGTIYFDTGGGCCAAPGQRLSANVVGVFPDHDWTAWHHFAFVKDGGAKAVYVDGNLLVSQEDGAVPLPTEYTQLTIGGQNNSSPPNAVLDDVAIFKGALTAAEIQALAAGGSPFAPPVDTDKDGMPDDYETANGFNPNDATDAAKDCDNDGASNVAEYTAGTPVCDTTPPVLNGAVATATYNTVVVTFSESVDPTVASNISHYTITPALAVTAASVKKNVVTLTTAAQTPGATKYTLAVNGVLDTSKNAVAANSSAVFYSYLATKDGVLKFSYWVATGPDEAGTLNGTAVETLVNFPRYPASPNSVEALFSFNSRDAFPNDSHEQYGATIDGFLTPTESGSYRFFVHSDDAGQLSLSSDDKESNLAQIAEEPGCCNNFTEPGDHTRTSEPIALVAGKKYFIRGIYKEGGGGDYMRVAWRKEGSTTPAGLLQPIPSQFLSAAVNLPAPPEGAFVSQVPAPKAKGVAPNTKITIVHRDGKTAWTADNVTLKVDGVSVTPTFSKAGSVATIEYTPPALLASLSTHTVTLGYPDAGGNPAVTEYAFTTFVYNATTKDKVGGYPGLVTGSGNYTADAGGHTAKAGDYGIDTTLKGGPVATYAPAFLAAANAATANDELSISFWQKKHDTSDSSAFVMHSPSTGNNRAFHAHVPWSNQNIYFDTVGCCDGTTQRITADINTFPDYTTGDPRDNLWWTTQWHHFVFTKKGSAKNIYIDGKLFLSGESTAAMPTDINAFYMGSGAGGTAELSHAIIDDFSVYSKELSEANASALSKGTLPTALPAATGLIGFWDFNDKSVAPPTPPTLSAAAGAAGKIVVTFQGTLQKTATIGGTFTDVTGTSPLTLDAADSTGFFRAIRK